DATDAVIARLDASVERPAPRLDPRDAPTCSEPAPPAAATEGRDLLGTSVKHYEIIRELGRGGMGAVFLARDGKLGRLVALKMLHNRTPESAGRFLAEARATAHCKHENIVVIHEVDEAGGVPYMVLEHLEGYTLRERMDQRRNEDGSAPGTPGGLASP